MGLNAVRGAIHKKSCAHDLGQNYILYGVASIKWIWCARAGEVAAALLFHTHQSVETRILGTETSEKTNFRSWRKDKGQIVNFKFNLYILFMFIFNSFLNCNVFVIAVSEFCLLFLTKIDFKTGFQAFSFSNENLTLYRWIIKRLVCRTDLC